jgi:hypothetical protein
VSGLSASQFGPLSAPAIRAFAWEIILKANSLPSPGAAADWAKIDPLAAARFFIAPATTGDLEPLSVFSQVTRLKETKTSAEPVDLAAIFTETLLPTLSTPFSIAWPRPSAGTYASFVSNWGIDPTGALPPVVLSMAKATQVDATYPGIALVYPNVAAAEVFYSTFKLSVDKRCLLSATISPALGAGAQVDVDLPFMSRTFSFTGPGGTYGPLVIPADTTPPAFQLVRIRLKSPSAAQPDLTVSLTLTPSP